ncbi:MAG: hypothetical protein E7666_07375 [Ruminococcaceae bacterium]|nr:hypothetical protein [Oscillospiraceae bacterium]
MTKKKFQIGTVLEDNTEYYATEAEYHVYAKDTVAFCHSVGLAATERSELIGLIDGVSVADIKQDHGRSPFQFLFHALL